jgi:hypothetical protein
VDLFAVLGAAEPALELGGHRLECCIKAVGACLGSGYRPLASGSDLDALAVLSLASIRFVVKFDIEQKYGGIEALEARQLLCSI